ncbi:hypothetical protein [Rhizobium sp. BR 362]
MKNRISKLALLAAAAYMTASHTGLAGEQLTIMATGTIRSWNMT